MGRLKRRPARAWLPVCLPALAVLVLTGACVLTARAADPSPQAGAAGQPAGVGDWHPAQARAARAFSDRRHRFCHDPEYPLTREELQWCQLFPGDKAHPSCPMLARVCAAGARAQLTGWRRPLEINMPALPFVGRGLLWLLLAVATGLLLYVVFKDALSWRWRRSAGEKHRPHPAAPLPAPASPAGTNPVETDVLRLLDRARAALAAGDHRRAVAEAYAALLRKLEGAGAIRVEAHRTNGDYLRDLNSKQPALRGPVSEVVGEVERVEFGGQAPGEERSRWVLDRVVAITAGRLGPTTLLLLLLWPLLALAGCQDERESWDDSPSGRSALRQVLSANGKVASERLGDVSRIDAKVKTLVVLPEARLDAGDWTALRGWVAAGGNLVVAGPPDAEVQALGDQEQDGKQVQGKGRRPGHIDGTEWIEVTFARAGTGAPVVDGRDPIFPIPAGVTVPASPTRVDGAPGKARPLLWRRAGVYAVELPAPTPDVLPATEADDEAGEDEDADEDAAPSGRLLVFADHHLFTNAALLVPGNAVFLTALLSAGGGRLQFAGALTGIVSPSPVATISRGRLAPLLLQLALAAALFFIFKGAHFGRPRPEPPPRRRAFADHVRALGLVYARARAGRVSLEHYGGWATERLSERLRLHGSSRLSAIAEALAARTGRPLGEVMRLLVEARPGEGPPRDQSPAQQTEALADLRALAALVDESAASRAGAGARPTGTSWRRQEARK